MSGDSNTKKQNVLVTDSLSQILGLCRISSRAGYPLGPDIQDYIKIMFLQKRNKNSPWFPFIKVWGAVVAVTAVGWETTTPRN